MIYNAINIQGNIISSEILEKIRTEDIKYQAPADFKLDRHTSVRDEIGIAWAAARAHWQAFQMRRDRLKDNDTGTSETRQSWIIPFLRELGYELEKSPTEMINNKSYAISHRAINRDGFPVHIIGINQSLDQRADSGGTRLSPHALVQEYVNNHEHLYAMVTNGKFLRLLRDATRLSRLSYLEFNLDQIMDEDLFSEFAVLFRALHVTRMPEKMDSGEESFFEYYHQEGLASGSRIREKLSEAVEQSLKILANGLLKHHSNEELRLQIREGNLKPELYYLHLLRLVYRMLFLLVIEERKLIYPEKRDEETNNKRDIYYKYYSLSRLAKLAEKQIYVDPRKSDLWQSLKTLFLLFENGYYSEKLSIRPLGSGLFAPNAIGDLVNMSLDNGTLLKVLNLLVSFENENKHRIRVNYADLDVEEFGSVYEGLLEYNAVFNEINEQPEFAFIKGDSRSSSGSHYTPEELVKPLLQHSLEYLIKERVESGQWLVIRENNGNEINITNYEIFKKLSGIESLAEINKFSKNDLCFYSILSQRRDLWINLPDEKSSSKHSGQHSRGATKEHNWGIYSIFGDCKWLFSGIGDFNNTLRELGISDTKALRVYLERMRRDREDVKRIVKEAERKLNSISGLWSVIGDQKLPTTHYSLSTKPIETALLSLKVLDDACGSGHILLSAARRIGLELARVRTNEDQPSPPAIRQATRDAIRYCIYGVDLNPLAVELCKVALWLEAHNPGEPLNFLDHHIKCGNAIVGLAHKEELKNGIADEAFKTLPGDDKEIAQGFSKRNKAERKLIDQTQLNFEGIVEEPLSGIMETWGQVNRMPENTPAEIEAKQIAYDNLISGPKWWKLKTIADMQVAQFFIPKTSVNKDCLVTDADYRQYLTGHKTLQDRAAAKAVVVSQEKHFFHWFLEFPEVFAAGGFDCNVGNPPFLGDRRLKEAYGEAFLEWIRFNFTEGGTVDLVVYFFLRNSSILHSNGFMSLISTNTVAQGKAREFGLERIINNGFTINHAIKGMKWPGLAAVEVSIISIFRGVWNGKFVLNGKLTKQISAFLDEADNTGTPFPLFANEGKSFQGSIILGTGFIIDEAVYKKLIQQSQLNSNVLFPYLNGDDLNNNPDQSHSRFVINFYDWEEKKAEQYRDVFEIIYNKVKPERQRFKEDKEGNPIEGDYALRMPLPIKWWQHAEKRPALYKTIMGFERILVSCRVSKYVNQSFIEVGKIFDVATSVVARSEYWEYALLQNTLHESWAWKYASTLESRIRYVNVDCIDTFPFPYQLSKDNQEIINKVGETYHEFRKQLMLRIQLGLTKTYNLFHSPKLAVTSPQDMEMDDKTFEKKFGKDAALLRKHLAKTEGTCSFNEAVEGIIKLRELHVEMDNAVLEAYESGQWSVSSVQSVNSGQSVDSGQWTVSSGQSVDSEKLPTNHNPLPTIQLRHDFYEVDYLPENDRIRYTIHPDARKEILKRLLELNHKIHEEEVKSGLWDKKKSSGKKKTDKNEDMNEIFE